MRRYLFNRLLRIALTLAGLVTLIFVITRLAPVDPIRAALGPDASYEEVEAMRREYGLDQPLPTQFAYYLGQLARGDLGTSIATRRPVVQELARAFPATIELVLVAAISALLIGTFMGVVAALNHNRPIDAILRVVSVSGVALPNFWLALLLQIFLSVGTGWFPLGGRIGDAAGYQPAYSSFVLVDTILTGHWSAFGSALRHLVLPAFVLSLTPICMVARFVRSSVLDVCNADYIRTARSKGLSERVVVYNHMLKNALIPVITMAGLYTGWALGGSFVVEVVFSWPGMGLYSVQAALASDFPAISAGALLVGATFAVINFIVDFSYCLLDPRIRYE